MNSCNSIVALSLCLLRLKGVPAPKNKIYTAAITPPGSKRKYYKAPYLHFRGEEIVPERAMEDKYLSMQQKLMKRQKEEQQFIELAHGWGAGKSKVDK